MSVDMISVRSSLKYQSEDLLVMRHWVTRLADEVERLQEESAAKKEEVIAALADAIEIAQETKLTWKPLLAEFKELMECAESDPQIHDFRGCYEAGGQELEDCAWARALRAIAKCEEGE